MNSNFQKFLLGFAATLLISLSWSIPLLFMGMGDEACHAHATRWLKHQLTYGVTHHVFFPVAVGIFVATVKLKVVQRAGKAAWASLLALFLLSTLLTFDDAISKGRRYQPYELQDSCRWLCLESALRQAPPRGPLPAGINSKARECLGGARDPDADLRALYNQRRTFQTFNEVLARTNAVGRAAIFLTWAFVCFSSAFVWYCGVVTLERDVPDTVRFRLSAVLLLLTLWIPSRIYANWYESAYLDLPGRNSTALVGAILSLGVFAFLLFSAIVNRRIAREAVIDALGILVPLSGFLLVRYWPYMPEVSAALSGLSGLQVLAICFVLLFLLINGARLVLGGTDEDEAGNHK